MDSAPLLEFRNKISYNWSQANDGMGCATSLQTKNPILLSNSKRIVHTNKLLCITIISVWKLYKLEGTKKTATYLFSIPH
jgi:hypothetical protein